MTLVGNPDWKKAGLSLQNADQGMWWEVPGGVLVFSPYPEVGGGRNHWPRLSF